MKPNTVRLLVTGCLVCLMTGCQAGKLNMNSLAFWRKNDQFDSNYIEPPAHKFTPGQTEVAANTSDSAPDDDTLPPLPPNVDRTMESFEEEVTRTYQELAQQNTSTQQNTLAPRGSNSIQPVDVDTSHVSSPPAGFGNSEFNSPLTPRASDNNSATVSAPANSNDFVPLSPAGSDDSDTPQYERLAQQMLEPARPPANVEQPPVSMPEIRTPEMSNPLSPAQGGDFAASPSQPAPSAQRVQNPYASSRTQTPAQPLQPRTPPQVAAQTTTPPAQPSANPVTPDQYPTTPYRAFEPDQLAGNAQATTIPSPEPATMPDPPASTQQMANNGTGGLTLQLQGQGTYAPGSVRPPDALDPGSLQLPQSIRVGNSNSGGGAFQPR